MRHAFMRMSLIIAAIITIAACGGVKEKVETSVVDEEEAMSWQEKADEFLDEYQKDFAAAEIVQTKAYWKAANSGKKEDFDAFAAAELALKKLHSCPDKFAAIEELLTAKDALEPLTVRALEVAFLDFKGNQLPDEMLEKMVGLSTDIEKTFNTFRGVIDGKKLSNNDLLEMLRDEDKTAKRKVIWETLKQVGAAVGPKLIDLARIRNEAATKLGYKNFWEMKIRLQEHDPAGLLAIFDELEKLTDKPFKEMKTELDKELAKRFKTKPGEMMPWHYDNPFFQAAPPSSKIDLDVFFKDKKKEDIAELARKFYADISLPADDLIERSDLYEREGKDQHAFCIDIDRQGDVRTLLNVKPTADWMETMLHELGHAVYDKFLDRNLPFNLREAAHILTTEGVAMLFGALGKSPTWLVDYAGVDSNLVQKNRGAILEQRRREQLIFARWTMVMLHFEKALYEDPNQDLNKLWWDYVERFQLLTRPEGRDATDWAAKPHFTIAPVYYHNYMLGELFASQLRGVLGEKAGHKEHNSDLSFTGRKDFGEFLVREVFRPGKTKPWPEFVKEATGKDLEARYFALELQ
ncbi:MAG: M2 family metallopeptidase [Deltaproteobacteria bacterium]|nr:M2 family metallopeptidase [Deltaproteobacteria bacterium]